MANLLCDTLSHPDDTRALLRALYTTEADLIPDYQQHTTRIMQRRGYKPRPHAAAQSSEPGLVMGQCDCDAHIF